MNPLVSCIVFCVGRRRLSVTWTLCGKAGVFEATAEKSEKTRRKLWHGIGFKAKRDSCSVGALRIQPNDRGEPLNLSEPVCRICFKTVSTKTGNTTNMHMHLKHNHPLQFCLLWNACCAYCLIFFEVQFCLHPFYLLFLVFIQVHFLLTETESPLLLLFLVVLFIVIVDI